MKSQHIWASKISLFWDGKLRLSLRKPFHGQIKTKHVKIGITPKPNPRTIYVFLVDLSMGCDTYFSMYYFLYFQHNSTTLIVMIFPGTTFTCNCKNKWIAFSFQRKSSIEQNSLAIAFLSWSFMGSGSSSGRK